MTEKMNPEVKALWLDALRSGDYAQGKKALKSLPETGPERFCCLGVLCDLHAQQTGDGAWQALTVPRESYSVKVQTGLYPAASTTELPGAVSLWSGLPPRDEKGLLPPVEIELVARNDAGSPFSEIADWIEANL